MKNFLKEKEQILIDILKEEDSLYKVLEENHIILGYYNEYKYNLSEGLIRTENINKSVEIIKRKFNLLPDEIIAVDTNKIILSVNNSNRQNIKKIFLELTNWLNNLGWFVSNINKLNKTLSGIEVDNEISNYHIINLLSSDIDIKIQIVYNAKFDIISSMTDNFYHISPFINRGRILKNGLVPKTKNKLFNYPDRIYLSKNKQDLIHLAPKLKRHINRSDKVKFDIYLVKISKTEKIYNDPNFNKSGVFILNTISPKNIEIIDTIEV